jgi:hypothetical protein
MGKVVISAISAMPDHENFEDCGSFALKKHIISAVKYFYKQQNTADIFDSPVGSGPRGTRTFSMSDDMI